MEILILVVHDNIFGIVFKKGCIRVKHTGGHLFGLRVYFGKIIDDIAWYVLGDIGVNVDITGSLVTQRFNLFIGFSRNNIML